MKTQTQTQASVSVTPQVIESRVTRSGGGKVAIVDFGKVSSDYFVSIGRTYAIPEHWTEEQVSEFELAKLAEFRERIEPILDAEFNERYDQRNWK